MNKSISVAMVAVTFTGMQLNAQTARPAPPVKTGNEWKMPSDVIKRSKAFAYTLQQRLGLDSIQTRKVYDVYLANTKSVDEISVQAASGKEKEVKLRANRAAFNAKLKEILTPRQYVEYLKGAEPKEL